jgi:competence CoiA-like predicted nuclease
MRSNLDANTETLHRVGACLEVLDKERGIVFAASELLANGGEARLFRERMKTEELRSAGRPKYLCPLCGRRLSLRAGSDRVALHFAHPREPEHLCPYKTGDKHTAEQLAAMKYNGLKETRTHRLLKAWTWQSLRADNNTQRESVKTETRLRAKLPNTGYRVPDVRAIWKNRSLVFEAQIASTFVTTIAQRRIFYRQYGASLLWLFPRWPEPESRFTSKDIYYNNNFNVFVINQETVNLSVQSGQMTLEVWWANPREVDESERAASWEKRYATLDELTFDEEKQRVFLVDVDAELAEIRRKKTARARKYEEDRFLANGGDSRVPPSTTVAFSFDIDRSTDITRATRNMTEAATKLFESMQNCRPHEVARQLEWFICEGSLLQPKDVLHALVAADLLTPTSDTAGQEQALLTVFTFLFSLKNGRAMPDHRYKNLKQLENLVFNSYRQHYRLFISAADFWDRGNALDLCNPNSALERHKKQFKKEMSESPYSVASLQDRSFDRAILFVFPELQQKIERLSARPR